MTDTAAILAALDEWEAEAEAIHYMGSDRAFGCSLYEGDYAGGCDCGYPARVLALVAGLRKVVELHERATAALEAEPASEKRRSDVTPAMRTGWQPTRPSLLSRRASRRGRRAAVGERGWLAGEPRCAGCGCQLREQGGLMTCDSDQCPGNLGERPAPAPLPASPDTHPTHTQETP